MAPSKETLGLKSTYYFAKEIMGFDKLSPKLHGEVCEEIDEYIFKKREPFGLVLPRDHFKSTLGLAVCVKGFTHEALKGNYEHRTLIDCSVQELSRLHVAFIARTFATNQVYRRTYGDYYDKGGFNRDEIAVKQREDASGIAKEPNFKATSIKSERTGFHADFGWYDDLVGERNWGTKHTRNGVKAHFYASLQILEPGAPILYTGTPWHDGDILGELRKAQKNRAIEGLSKSFHFYRRAALEDAAGNPDDKHGEPIFPERFSKEYLIKEKKEKLPKFMWSAQWMTDASLPDYALPFNKDQMYVRRNNFPQRMRVKMLTLDPNFRNEDQESGDNACIVVGGLDAKANWWGLDVQLGQWKTNELINRVLDAYVMWRPHRVRIEKKFTAHFMTALQNEASKRGLMLPIEMIERDWRGKEQRFAGLQPLFASNRIFFAAEIDKLTKEEMEEELERVGAAAHDDFLDALSDQFAGGMIPMIANEADTFEEGPETIAIPKWGLQALGYMQMSEEPALEEVEDSWM